MDQLLYWNRGKKVYEPVAMCNYDPKNEKMLAPNGKVTIIRLQGEERDPFMVDIDQIHVVEGRSGKGWFV